MYWNHPIRRRARRMVGRRFSKKNSARPCFRLPVWLVGNSRSSHTRPINRFSFFPSLSSNANGKIVDPVDMRPDFTTTAAPSAFLKLSGGILLGSHSCPQNPALPSHLAPAGPPQASMNAVPSLWDVIGSVGIPVNRFLILALVEVLTRRPQSTTVSPARSGHPCTSKSCDNTMRGRQCGNAIAAQEFFKPRR